MYDTVKMYYDFLDNPKAPTESVLFKNCKRIEATNGELGCYAKGKLKNMTVFLNERSISVQGSLCKYFYGNNIETLSLTNTREALNQISADLSIDIHKARVTRIDFSTNIITDYTPTVYYPYMGELSLFERSEKPHSIYYNQEAKRLLFYDKIKEAKKKKMDIPVEYIGKNLLRYELVLNKDVPRFLKHNGLYGKDLGSEELYRKLLHLWHSYYKQIQKHSKTIKIMADNIKTPKDVETRIFNALVRKNPKEVQRFLKELKAQNVFEHKEYYSRLNSKIRNIHKTQVVENPLIEELSSKIEDIYIELM
jgi:hypothetical protein